MQKVQGKMTRKKKLEKGRIYPSFQENLCNYSGKGRTVALGKSCDCKMMKSILKHA